jgi:hypothetical protein
MKNLFVILATFLLSTTVYAGTGFFYDPDRNGEGIIVTIDKNDRLAFALFTYWDAQHAIPPSVSPAPPPSPIKPQTNTPVWYVGNGAWLDGISVGDIYMSVPIDYPNVAGESLDEKIIIGQYLIVANKAGFDLQVNCNTFLPPSMYICNNTFTFYELIIGE